jgi:SAM-dependent methyltransferase
MHVMRNAERWAESKYVWRQGAWRASGDVQEVGVGSRLISNRIAALYQQQLPAHARGRLVDLGCGKAPLYGMYKSLTTSVTCVDWPQSPHGDLHVDQACDLAGRLPFADGSFDTIVLSDVLEHVHSPEPLWAEMARVLAPGGRLVLNVPFLYGIHEAPHDHARYTEFALRRFAQRSGLEVMTLLPVGGSLHVLADFLAKHLAHLPLLGAVAAQGLQAAVGWLDGTALGQRLLAKTAPHFPLGYFMVAAKRAAPSA